MKLYHITNRANLESINEFGLLPERAVNKEKAVWLVSKKNILWALAHTAAKPGRGAVTDLVVLTCNVARSKLRRYRKGIWRSFEVVRHTSVEESSVYTDSYPE